MNQKRKVKTTKPKPVIKGRPIPGPIKRNHSRIAEQDEIGIADIIDLQPAKEESKVDLVHDTQEQDETSQKFVSEVQRFIEISKHFTNPLQKTASYICEHSLVSYPNPYRLEYKRGGVTTQHIKFSNLSLEPVYVKLFKLTPDLEQLKYINLTLSRSKRIPPGLSFNLGFIYDDVNEKPSCNAKMVFVASRKTTTPCYQVCEIELLINAMKVKIIPV